MEAEMDSLFQNLLVFLANGKYPLIDKIRELRSKLEILETKSNSVEKENLFVFNCSAYTLCMISAKDRDHAHELRPNRCKFKTLSTGSRHLEYIAKNCKCYDVNNDFAGELEGRQVNVTLNPFD